MKLWLKLIILGSSLSFSLTAHSAQQTGIEIERIDILGAHAFSEQALEAALEVSPGDQLERPKVIRTEENLQTLYRMHGYEEVSIKSRLVKKRTDSNQLETALEFDIHEGKPTRVARIRLSLTGTADEATKRRWKERERRLELSLGILAGDIFDQEKVSQGRRAIQELLASDEYIGAKVDQGTVVPVELTAAEVKQRPEDAARWVGLEFQVVLGERVSFGFRGNTVFTRGFLSSLIQEQRLLGLGKDYIGVIRSRIQEEYRSVGYSRAEISHYTIESRSHTERKVIYTIKEGPRVKIDSVQFDGNLIFSSDFLRNKFFEKASGLVQKGVFAEKDVQKAAELLIEWLKENGYLSSKLITINSFYPPKPKTQEANNSVRLVIYLYEGDQTLVRKIETQGSEKIERKELLKLLGIQEGGPLNLYALSEGIEKLKKTYRDKGYLNFRVLNEGSDALVVYSKENRYADILIQIDEGPKYRVSHIEIEGLEKTQEKIVRRELTIQEGEVLTEYQLGESERQIRRLGVFSTVMIRTTDDPGKPGFKVVRVTVHEAERGILSGGPGFRNDLGVRAFGQLAYTNLWGLNHTASVSANVNRRYNNYHFFEGQIQFAYAWPWFGMRGLTFRPTVFLGQTQYINFAAQTVTISTSWDKQLLAHPNMMGYFSYTFERIRQFNAQQTVDDQQLRIATVTPKLSVDFRDNPLVPTQGFFAVSWVDLAHPVLGSQTDPYTIGYYRAQFRSDYYQPIWKGIVLYTSFRTGFERSFGLTSDLPQSIDAIPLIKQFALGGIGSLRGYQELELNKASSTIQGSLSYVNYRTQIDFPFSGALKFGVFLDAANLLVDDFSFGRLKYGTGFGFHYQTPVGAVNFDWGFKLDPPPNVSPYVIHFSVGVI
jgi:outer membrane protein insertion porin family